MRHAMPRRTMSSLCLPCPESDGNGAESDSNGAKSDQNGAESDGNGAKSDQNGAESDCNGVGQVRVTRFRANATSVIVATISVVASITVGITRAIIRIV